MMQTDTDESDFPAPGPRGKRLKRFCLVLLLFIAVVYLFFWWPRSMPDYIRLPEGHGEVQVETWTHALGLYRHFYLKTEAPRPWQEISDELTAGEQTRVEDFIEYSKPLSDDTESWRQWVNEFDNEDAYWKADTRLRRARDFARPSRNGGFGEPLPDSFVVFWVNGPDKDEARHHVVTYRLTPLGEDRTCVEVWDNKFFDH